MLLPVRLGEITALADVPGDAGGVFWIGVVGTGLADDAHYPHGHEDGVGDGGQERVPDVQDKHGCFDQQDEGAQHGKYDIESGESGNC